MLQSFKRRGLKALVQFLMPELLAGVIVAIAIRSNLSGLRSGFMFQVVFSTSLFILFAESRRVFVVESDTENFYYSPPTLQYHIAIFISFVVISILVAAAIAAAPVFLLFNSPHDFNILISAVVVGWLNSLNLFFILLILVRYIGRNHIKSSLIMLQIFSGIALLAVMESAGKREYFFMSTRYIPLMIIIFLFLFAFFVLSSTAEEISKGLSATMKLAIYGLDALLQWIGRPFFLRDDYKYAGFLFMAANFWRDQILRLTVIGVIAMPYAAVVYSLLSIRNTQQIASMMRPLTSIIAVGVFSYYFLAQSITVSSNSEGKWLFQTVPLLNERAFINGCRKATVFFVHLPATLLIFTAALSKYPIAYAFLFVLSYHIFTYAALTWYFIFLKNFPLSVSFRTLGATSIPNLLFAFAYSFLSIWALLVLGHGTKELILLDLFVFAFTAMIESISSTVLNHRKITGLFIN